MMNLYGFLKFLHVLSVVLWVGGVTALWITTLRLAAAGDHEVMTRLVPVGMRYGQRIVGPSSGIVLITGIWMAAIGHLFSTPWVGIGIIGIALHFILGATLIRRNWLQLGQLVAQPSHDTAALAAVVKRTTTVSWIYIVIMVIVIAAMVMKP